jgi:pimeloyl-ACP methyl ester carboxylesterase
VLNYLKWIIPVVLVAALIVVYLIPVPSMPFDKLYAKVDPKIVQSLVSFRQNNPTKAVYVDGVEWDYVIVGSGTDTILFLHGMTGSYDIWWNQIDALSKDYRIISVTYPAVNSLEEMDKGISTIIDYEKIDQVNLVGTSLGGYFAQYLVTHHSAHIMHAVFANTFPPNKLIAQKNGFIGAILPYLPEWVVMNVLRGSFANSIYPTSGNDELTLAFLNEIGYGRMSKAQVVGRYRSVVEPFTAPDIQKLGVPVLIIESDNDPLVELALRDALKSTYPSASVYTFHAAGHFPYLNHASEYTDLLKKFFATPINQ